MYIFVIDNDPICLSVLLVCFLSWQKLIRSVLLYHRYNIMFKVDPKYFNYSSAYEETYIFSVQQYYCFCVTKNCN
jgi:hypothetical protein